MSERLAPLLEWVNVNDEAEERRERNLEERKMPRREVQRRLMGFVKSFDGFDTPALQVRGATWPESLRTGHRLEELRLRLKGLLLGQRPAVAVRSLEFRVEWGLDVTEAGVNPLNTMIVGGTVPDLVLYLAARLMTEEQVELDLCEAPEARLPGRPKEGEREVKRSMCGNLFVVTGRGYKKRYCSDACKGRMKMKNAKGRGR